MEDDTPMTFDSVEQERDYWREKYQDVSDTWEDAKVEVEMIQLQSEDQEQHVAALGDEIDALGKQVADIRYERDELRRKFGEEMRALNESIAGMQLSIDNLTSERDNAKRTVVLLEQGNDDLEREHRNAHSSFLDIESKYNRLVEEKVLLEEELRATSVLVEEVQRLRSTVNDQSDEIAILENSRDKQRQRLEAAEADRLVLESRIAELEREPLRRSTSAVHLGTPSPTQQVQPVSRSAFMSPVTEGYEDSPRNTISSSSSMRTLRAGREQDSPGTPSQLPVLRPGRVDSLRARVPRINSPGSPSSPNSMRRSNTMNSLSPSPRTFEPGPARGLNRSTNSRHLPDLAGPDTPVKARMTDLDASPYLGREKRSSMYGRSYHPLNVSTNSNATVTTMTPRKQSTGASSALASQRDMTSKTAQLLTRMGKLGAKSGTPSVRSAATYASWSTTSAEPRARVITRKPSFSQKAHQGINAVVNHLGRSRGADRVVSTSSHRNIMSLRQHEQEADVTMIMGSPADSWVHVRERTAQDNNDISPTLMTNRGKSLRDRYTEEAGSERESSIASSTSHPLPSRGAIPSPMVPRTSHQEAQRPTSRASSHLSAASGSSSRPITPSGLDTRLPVRPSSRVGSRPLTTTSSQLPRPSSRLDYDRSAMRSPSPPHLNVTSPIMRDPQYGLPLPRHAPTSSIDQTGRSVRRTSAHLGQVGKQRLADPPGSAGPVKSRIPRKSLPGKPGIEVPDTAVPPLPGHRQGADLDRPRGATNIGKGFPSATR